MDRHAPATKGSRYLGRQLPLQIHAIGSEGSTFMFDEDGSFIGRTYAETGGWEDLEPLAAVDTAFWKECEERLATFGGELTPDPDDDDSEWERGVSTVWITISTDKGEFIIDVKGGRIMREE